MESIFFSIVALAAVISAIMVVGCKNPINSALSLVVTFFSLATFYVMLDAPFMAAIQVIVYAGAIMVLIVFVIMLLNLRVEAGKKYMHAILAGSIVGFFLLLNTVYFLSKSSLPAKGAAYGDVVNKIGHTEMIGKALFTDYLLPFEITSILLLAAIVGSVVLAKRKL